LTRGYRKYCICCRTLISCYSDFAAPRGGAEAWEGASVLSSETELSASYALVSPPDMVATRAQKKLSPVVEGATTADAGTHVEDSYFEMVAPSRPKEVDSPLQRRATISNVQGGPSAASGASASGDQLSQEITFTRQPVLPVQPQKSALTAMLAASSSPSSNPFTELYGAISGRGESAAGAVPVRVYFPHAREPAGAPMDLRVRRDATVEEVLGYALWSYWEEGWLPKIGEMVNGDEDPRLTAVGWIMRIAEDDGEVDEDFPRKWPRGWIA
jgi:hypothetical protein